MTLPAYWVNGRPADSVGISDRGLLYGDSLFETLRYHRGRFLLRGFHQQRLHLGCDAIGLPFEGAALASQLELATQFARENDVEEAVCRVTITRGEGGRGYAYTPSRPNWMVALHPVTPSWRENLPPANVVTCDHRALEYPPLVGLKHGNRLAEVMAAREVAAAGADEGLMLDGQGCLVSATSANLFLVSDGKLLTPTLDRAGIAGTVRRLVLEVLAGQVDCEVCETRLDISDALEAQELFICNSAMGIRGVAVLDGVAIGNGTVTASLQEAYFGTVEQMTG